MDNSSPITQQQIDELAEVAELLFMMYIKTVTPHLIEIAKSMYPYYRHYHRLTHTRQLIYPCVIRTPMSCAHNTISMFIPLSTVERG